VPDTPSCTCNLRLSCSVLAGICWSQLLTVWKRDVFRGRQPHGCGSKLHCVSHRHHHHISGRNIAGLVLRWVDRHVDCLDDSVKFTACPDYTLHHTLCQWARLMWCNLLRQHLTANGVKSLHPTPRPAPGQLPTMMAQPDSAKLAQQAHQPHCLSNCSPLAVVDGPTLLLCQLQLGLHCCCVSSNHLTDTVKWCLSEQTWQGSTRQNSVMSQWVHCCQQYSVLWHTCGCVVCSMSARVCWCELHWLPHGHHLPGRNSQCQSAVHPLCRWQDD